jgi:hypothetical protein
LGSKLSEVVEHGDFHLLVKFEGKNTQLMKYKFENSFIHGSLRNGSKFIDEYEQLRAILVQKNL